MVRVSSSLLRAVTTRWVSAAWAIRATIGHARSLRVPPSVRTTSPLVRTISVRASSSAIMDKASALCESNRKKKMINEQRGSHSNKNERLPLAHVERFCTMPHRYSDGSLFLQKDCPAPARQNMTCVTCAVGYLLISTTGES